MGFPTITAELGLGAGVFTDPGSWTAISSYLHALTSRRGRPHELGRVEAGVATARLKNKDGRFTPENGSSPYSPDVVPLTQIRFRGTYNSITYGIFRGFVEEWPPDFPNRKASTVDLSIVDALGVMNRTEIHTLSSEILADSPVSYWPMQEAAGAAAVAQGSAPVNATIIGGVTLGASGPLNNGAFSFDGSSGYLDMGAGALELLGDLTIEAYVYLPAWGTPLYILEGDRADDVTTPYPYKFQITGGGRIDFQQTIGNSSGIVDDVQQAALHGVPEATWVHVAVTRTGRAISLYLNGSVVTLASFSGGGTVYNAYINGQSVGPNWRPWVAHQIETGPAYTPGRVAHLAIYDKGLTPARIAAHAAAPIDDLAAAPSGTVIGRVLDAVGWPSGLRSIDAGNSIIQAHAPATTALAELQAIAEAEMGTAYVDPDGKIVFRERHATHKAPYNVSAATIGDQAAQVPYERVKPSYDMTNLYGRVRVGRAGGVVQQAEDAASLARFGGTLARENLLISSDLEAADAANYLLGRYKDPHLRVDEIVLRGEGSDLCWPQILDREILDRITVVKTPPGGAPTITKDVVIEQISHDVTRTRRWKCTYSTAPAEALTYWLLGDATYGLLGQTTTLGY